MRGYYKWIDGQEKYTCGTPIAGTDFNIASTVYLGEFTLPMQQLEVRTNQLTAAVTRSAMIVLATTAVLVALIVIIYSYWLSGRLKSLSDAADRISLGNIDVEMKEIKSRDEIEDLADAFSRMQASIRLAIKRLRERG